MLQIPTHDGSGQATHPSILFFDSGWNGYRYWMAMTPYPHARDSEEDPNIIASNDGVTWSVPEGLSNPLDDEPGGRAGYNSDTNLAFADGTMFLTWRRVRNRQTVEFLMRTSTDGVHWTDTTLIATPKRNTLSQSLVRMNGKWRMYAIQTSPGENELVYWETDDLFPAPSSWGQKVNCSTNTLGPDYEPWHVDVQLVDGHWYGLMADTAWNKTGALDRVHMMVSDDGDNWTVAETPLFPTAGEAYDAHYKSGFVVKTSTEDPTLEIFASVFDSKTGVRNLGKTLAVAN